MILYITVYTHTHAHARTHTHTTHTHTHARTHTESNFFHFDMEGDDSDRGDPFMGGFHDFGGFGDLFEGLDKMQFEETHTSSRGRLVIIMRNFVGSE